MKKFGFVIFVFAVLISCESLDDKPANLISAGYYQGRFEYQNASYWCSIFFENGKYEEWPSGGARYQKSMSRLTVGTYSIRRNTLSFALDTYKSKNFPEKCTPSMLLPGNYELVYSGKNDSLVFTRGNGESEITYFLKRLDAGEN